MKTYLEWHYDTPPPKNETVEIAVQFSDGITETMPARWNGFAWREVVWQMDLPSTWRVYAWAHRRPAVPPVNPDKA